MGLEKYDDIVDKLPIAIVRTLLSISGIWPSLSTFQISVRTLVVNVGLFAVCAIQVIGILSTELKAEMFLQLTAYLATSTCLLIIYYAGLFNKKVAPDYVNRILTDCWDLLRTKEYEIFFKYGTLSKTYIMTFLICFLTYTTATFLYMCIPVLLDAVKPLNETRPRILIFPMDWINEKEKHFMKLLVLQYGLLLLMGISAIAVLSAYIIFLQHICAMFRIVGSLLDEILEEQENQSCVPDDHEINVKIIRIIGYHNRTIEFMDDLNAKFNTAYLAVVTSALGFTGICVIQLLRENEDSGFTLVSVRIIFYILGHLIFVFLFCYIGQHLNDTSSLVFDKIYATPWYSMPKRSQRLLLFMILRAGKSSSISIGRMFTASHEFFAGLIKLSVSVGTVFCSLR